jgi:hypothetical protein
VRKEKKEEGGRERGEEEEEERDRPLRSLDPEPENLFVLFKNLFLFDRVFVGSLCVRRPKGSGREGEGRDDQSRTRGSSELFTLPEELCANLFDRRSRVRTHLMPQNLSSDFFC